MAETHSLDPFNLDSSAVEAEKRPAYRRIGLLNGLLIGLALGLGAWGLEAWHVAQLPVTGYMPSLALGLGLMVIMGGLVGWLTSRIALTPVAVALWALTGVLGILIMGYTPYYGRTLMAWLADWRFRGRDVYPYVLEGSVTGLILGGLLIILVLAVLGLLQSYRLENITSEVSQVGRLSRRGWISLLVPLPLVFLAGLVTQSVMANPTAPAVEITNRAILVAQDFDGDLRDLNLGDGISYIALRPVQDMIDGDFMLSIVDINPLNATVVVRAEFSEGAWVYCRVINGQLTFCDDASPAYTRGLRSLITGEPLPDRCRGCGLQSPDEVNTWLAERRDRLGRDPVIERVAQEGSHVLMSVTGDDGYVIECWIEGVGPTRVTECREVGGGQ